MQQTIIGLAMVALTALFFYIAARRRYKCPYCGQFVRWKDINCPHCGNDMQFKHRAGPEPLPKSAAGLRPPRRGR
ncbi:MAG TPA: zinc ribbon domain-containing protein [Candidatus Binataceae bacterium]